MVPLNELIGAVIDVDPATINDDSSPLTVDGWDSLAHISLISAIEETYSVDFTAAEMRKASSVGELRRLLSAKGVQL